MASDTVNRNINCIEDKTERLYLIAAVLFYYLFVFPAAHPANCRMMHKVIFLQLRMC